MLIFPTYNFLKGLLIIWNIIFYTTNASKFEGNLPDLSMISTLFNMFIKPYLKTWHLEPTPRAFEESIVERVVRQKIKQLQPFLQNDDADDTEMDNEITFEGNDETTIIEFVPHIGKESQTNLRNGNDTFKTNMRKYKKLRNKIYEALEAESVSDKTKTLVMQTLDELLSKMVETQCHWKGGTEADNINSRFIVPRTIVNMWRDEWQKFKTKFITLGHLRARNQVNNFDVLMSHLTKLNSIINDVSGNMETFSKKYRIRCNVTEKKDLKKNKSISPKYEPLRLSYVVNNENICKNFKVCSNELKTFFINFYNAVNDTSVSALRSYAEMYTRDVNTDVSNEKSSIVDLIFKIADQTEKDIIKIFVNYTTNFHLDQNKKKEANINFLLEYIKNVIKYVKETVSTKTITKLKHVHKIISSSIQQDVEANLGVDLENLQKNLTGKICLIFNYCNGNQKNRRRGDNDVEKENSINNENKIYVKVEVTIDEERNDLLKNNVDTKSTKLVPKLDPKMVSDVFPKSRNIEQTTSLNYEKYANITVTRTTTINADFLNKTVE